MQNKPHKFSFEGRAVEYFGFWLINVLLRAFTFGLYYPWAKTNLRKFFYSNTKFAGSNFTYHGNGLELFIGLLKAIGIILSLLAFGYLFVIGQTYLESNPFKNAPNLLILLKVKWMFFVTITPFVLLPIALHGSTKYLAQRVSWRGIHFKYHGELKDLIFLYLKYGFLIFMGFAMFFGFTDGARAQKITIVTPTLLVFLAAIFYTTFFVETRGYIFNRITWGDVEVRWYGDGVTFFMLRLRFLFPILLFAFYMHLSSQSLIADDLVHSASIGMAIFKAIGLFFLFAMVMFFAYIWYLHGYLHFIFSNFRLFQGSTECEVWHESDFGDTLKTWLSVVGIVMVAFMVVGIINTICTLIVVGLGGVVPDPSEMFNFKNLQLLLLVRVLVFVLVLAAVMPFIIMFLMRWIIDGIRIDHNLDVDNLTQTEQGKSEGFGDNLSDLFNIDLV